MGFRYQSGGKTWTVTVEARSEGYRVRVNDRSFDVVVRRSEGALLGLQMGSRGHQAIVVFDGDRRIVKVDDADPVTIVEGTRRHRGVRSSDGVDGRLAAAMDGQVAAVPVKKGDRVEAGTTLVVLEAMKMEMRVVAPFAGHVREIACAPGDVVERGRVLVVLEPEPVPPQVT